MSHTKSLWELGLATIRELETERGILASGKEEIFGCIFGRDSLITGMKLLRAYKKTQNPYFLSLVRKILINLAALQGREINIESGEEPGKIIHEFRPERHEHLTSRGEPPWFLYPDRVMRNYDSVDSTPLFLITAYEYYRVSGEEEFLSEILPEIHAALEWLQISGDSNHDGFIDYQFHPDRKYGGLLTQSWMDSRESVFHESGAPASYPIAPVEAQAYAYYAFKAWAHFFQNSDGGLAGILESRAQILKERFNEQFVIGAGGDFSCAFAIDGNGQPLSSPRSSMGHCLWAAFKISDGSKPECILDEEHIPSLVRRLMQSDLFVPNAGIRTLSTTSRRFAANSYHNGSIWPHDTAMISEGFENFGYRLEAKQIQSAIVAAFSYFQTPIELFVFSDLGYESYRSPTGQEACKKQAWSAAALLSDTLE